MKTKSPRQRKSILQRLLSTPEGKRLYAQEVAMIQIATMVWQIMESQSMTEGQFARRIRRKKAWLLAVFEGECDISIAELSDILCRFNLALELGGKPIQ